MASTEAFCEPVDIGTIIHFEFLFDYTGLFWTLEVRLLLRGGG